MKHEVLHLLAQKTADARVAAQVALELHGECRALLQQARKETYLELSVPPEPSSLARETLKAPFPRCVAIRESLEEECAGCLGHAIADLKKAYKVRSEIERETKSKLDKAKKAAQAEVVDVEKKSLALVGGLRSSFSPLGSLLAVILLPIAIIIWIKTYHLWRSWLPTAPRQNTSTNLGDILGSLIANVLGLIWYLIVLLLGWVPGYLLGLAGVAAIDGIFRSILISRESSSIPLKREDVSARWAAAIGRTQSDLDSAIAACKVAERWRAKLDDKLASIEKCRLRSSATVR